ncbi:MAG: hypothetical protein JO235_25985 [Chroococcidiopsidaceae cyanobacterium CP_BM_RX_35]|nr:hypothetical protein [Chroococcidiopsidaceae cyanobacterium CP_BM_RX_35]
MTSQLNRDPEIEAKARTLFDRTFRDSEGKIVIAQPPNLPILVGVAATLLELVLPGGGLQTGVNLVAFGALFTWAWLEVFQGVNYFRRSLGLITLVSLIAIKLHLMGA